MSVYISVAVNMLISKRTPPAGRWVYDTKITKFKIKAKKPVVLVRVNSFLKFEVDMTTRTDKETVTIRDLRSQSTSSSFYFSEIKDILETIEIKLE